MDAKLLVLGESSACKTFLVDRLLQSTYASEDWARQQMRSREVVLGTNFGPVRFDCWEISKDERCDEFIGAAATIIVLDINSRNSLKDVLCLYLDVVRICETIPIVVCGTSSDGDCRFSSVNLMQLDRSVGLPYFEINTRSRHDEARSVDDLFLWLVRKLFWRAMGAYEESHVVFVDPPSINPPEIFLTTWEVARIEAETAAWAAAAAPLPDEDEDL